MIDLKTIRAVEDEFIADGVDPSVVTERIARVMAAMRREDAQDAQRRASERRLTEIGLSAVKAALAEEIKRGLV